MSKRFKKVFLVVLLVLFSTNVLAEDPKLTLSADTVRVLSQKKLYAEGNVQVQQGQILIKAQSLIFDEDNDSLVFKNIEEFTDSSSDKLTADDAIFDSKLKEGVIHAARLLLDETIKVWAKEVKINDGQIQTANKITRITSCDECENSHPNWYFTASSATRDLKNLNIVYRNVNLKIKGVPVAYIPYLRLPDPSVDRARGFLVPNLVVTSNLGAGLKLPYFIPIGSSKDILLTPYISPKTNTLEYRYRQKFREGELTVKGAITNDDFGTQQFKTYNQVQGQLKLGYGIKLELNSVQVSENKYFEDYGYGSVADLNSKIILNKTSIDKERFLEGRLSYVRNKEDNGALSEYYSLNGDYYKNLPQTLMDGNFLINIGVNSAVNIEEDNSLSRPPSSARIGLEYNQYKSIEYVTFLNRSFVSMNSFVNSENTGNLNEVFNYQYGVSSLVSIPLSKKMYGNSYQIKPKIMVSYNEQKGDELGQYFIGANELSFGNIFAQKKYTSLSESEINFTVSAGVDYKVSWLTGNEFNLSFGALRLGGSNDQSRTKNGLNNKKFSYLSKVGYFGRSGLGVFGTALISESGDLLLVDLKVSDTFKNLNLEGNYEYINQLTDTRLYRDLENLNINSSYTFSPQVRFNAGGRFDLSADSFADTVYGFQVSSGRWDYKLDQEFVKEDLKKTSISAIYDDNCTRLSMSFENRYQDSGFSDSVKSLVFKVQLKPFADFSLQ